MDQKNSKVYFVPAENGDDLNRLAGKVKALITSSGILSGVDARDYIGIKLHFGEKENTGFIKPPIVKEVAKAALTHSKETALIETNTIYIGERSNTISHLRIAREHGFTFDEIGVPIIITDGVAGRDFVDIEINKEYVKKAKIASGVADFDCLIGLAHVTGHCQAGLGGALKNIGMGCASRAGKLEQHSSVLPGVTAETCIGCGHCLKWCPAGAIKMDAMKAVINPEECIGCGECTVACRAGAIGIKWDESVENLQKKMAEYAYAALLGKKKAFINFLIKITKDCDCMAKDDPRIVDDIGILASSDPVAIDAATIDLLLKAGGCDRLKEGYPEIDPKIQLEHASKIGLGNMKYELVAINA